MDQQDQQNQQDQQDLTEKLTQTVLSITNFPPTSAGEKTSNLTNLLLTDPRPIGLHVSFIPREEVPSDWTPRLSPTSPGLFLLHDMEGYLCTVDTCENLRTFLSLRRETSPSFLRKILTGYTFTELRDYAKTRKSKTRKPSVDLGDLL